MRLQKEDQENQGISNQQKKKYCERKMAPNPHHHHRHYHYPKMSGFQIGKFRIQKITLMQ